MNNQGLDALAALAAAASNSPYPILSSGSSSKAGGPKDETKSDRTAQSNSDATTHLPTPSANPTVPEIAAQQWQQAIANAASSLSALSAPGGGGQSNLALLGMPQQLNPTTAATNPNLIAIQQQLAMQQQLNYYQLLAHAAAQQQRQFGAANVPGAAATAAQALSQVLGVHTQTPFATVNGTFETRILLVSVEGKAFYMLSIKDH
jgi:hypothetical protein